jgi:hypothetical protein
MRAEPRVVSEMQAALAVARRAEAVRARLAFESAVTTPLRQAIDQAPTRSADASSPRIAAIVAA